MPDQDLSAPPDRARYERAAFPYLNHIVLAILFLGLYAVGTWPGMPGFNEGHQSTLGFLVYRWATDQSATHGWLVIPIAAIVTWYKREKLKRLPVQPDKRGLILVCLALTLHLVEKAIDLNGPSPLSIPIFLAGSVWYLCGLAWLRELAFPIAYLTFFLPVPGFLTQTVSAPLRVIATNGSRWIVERFFGLHIPGAGMDMELIRPSNNEHVAITIADPCSGIHSLMAIKALHAITAYVSRLRLSWKWVLFWLALPITLTANIIRITLLLLVCAYGDPKFGLGTFHDASPYPLFVIVLLLLVSIGRLLEKLTHGEAYWKERKAQEDALLAEPVGPYWAAPLQALRGGRTLGILMAITLVLSLLASNNAQFQADKADLHPVPMTLGNWTAPYGEDPLDNALLEADACIVRRYVRRDGQQVELMLVYRRYGRREFSHRPDYCFPNGGYKTIKEAMITLPFAGREAPAKYALYDGSKVLLGDHEGAPQKTVSYLFVSGNRSESSFMRQQLWMAIERFTNNRNGWALLRLVSPRVTTDDDALEAQKDFMRTFEKEIRKVITTDPTTAGSEGS